MYCILNLYKIGMQQTRISVIIHKSECLHKMFSSYHLRLDENKIPHVSGTFLSIFKVQNNDMT